MEQPSVSAQSVNTEALSIFESARFHARKRILIDPVLWTRLHLEILSCTFSQCSPACQDNMDVPPIDGWRIKDFKRNFYEKHQKWNAKEGSIQGILSNLKPLPFLWGRDLFLDLGGYPSVRLPCTYYCLGDNIPLAAHVDRSHIISLRGQRARPPIRRWNYPAIKLGRLKVKTVTPIEPLHDPYLVALLIALAQDQWRALGRLNLQQAAGLAGVTPKVMFSTEDRNDMYIYSANVPSSLIDMFDKPALKPPMPGRLSVQISSVPYEPIETLRGRLLAVLLSATRPEDVGKPERLIMYGYTCT
ncbi:hypothetical protein CP532_1985 [Ophiocordyceps camponoti-leonardi (nom. inval.)]|nr:hypothetical protein CP532_1985 [Ophiocordyceps camponoti-leonardi (nom. inval.)]